NICQPDPYGARGQSRDLREINSLIEPIYRAQADIFELSIDYDLTDDVTFTSQTVYARDEYYASQDYTRFTTLPIFTDSTVACEFVQRFMVGGVVMPTGLPCNPGGYQGGRYRDL